MDKFTKKVDQGENNYSFRLTVAKRESLERKTAEFVQKPYALNMFPIPVKDSSSTRFDLGISGDVIALSCLKKAEGEEAVILRLINNSDKKAEATVTVNNVDLTLSFGKYEVKTVKWSEGKLEEIYEMIV